MNLGPNKIEDALGTIVIWIIKLCFQSEVSYLFEIYLGVINCFLPSQLLGLLACLVLEFEKLPTKS